MSLRYRLIVSLSLVLVATLAFGSVLAYWHAVAKVETEMSAAIDVGARIAFNAIDDAEEVTNPRRRLELLVRDFDGDRHLKATLFNLDGSVAAVSKIVKPEVLPPEWLYEFIAAKPKSVDVALPRIFDGHGRIRLEADPYNEVTEVWDDLTLYGKIFAIYSVVALVVMYGIIGHALRPLRDLTNAFAKIGAGDYLQRVAVKGPREIGELSARFNSMAGRLREMEAGNRRLKEQLDQVQEEERIELSRNLHDEVSPLLFSVDVDALTIRKLTGSGDGLMGRIRERADAIQDATSRMKKNVKSVLGQLRPSGVTELRLQDMIENQVNFCRSRHPDVAFSVDVPDWSWGARIDSAVHTIVREAVSNALKHGRPSAISISVAQIEDDHVRVEVTDNGIGLGALGTSGGGFGIIGLSERAAKLGGTLTVENRIQSAGVTVLALLPVPSSNPTQAPVATIQHQLETQAS